MTATAHRIGAPSASDEGTEPRLRYRHWHRYALAAICLLAAALYGWGLWRSGWGNGYYSAAVKSMSRSVENFLFGAFDPAGVVTVDKPPMAFWPQVVSAWIFGYHGWSLLLPQVLEGVGAVFLLHRAVRVWAGESAALIAALVLALTPITVAINRDNNPDTLLVLLLVAAAYAFTRSVTAANARGTTRWLLLSAFLIGCGFVTKMMQAWIVLPVFAAAYLVGSPAGWGRRALDLAGAAVVSAVASLWWVALVDWWPGEKPYIGGSSDGSAWDLVVGYNGFGRIFGESRGGAVRLGTPPPGAGSGGPGGGFGAGGFGGGGFGGGGFGGEAGVTRMFGEVVGGQISWLLPLSLLVLVVVAVSAARRTVATPRPVLAGWVLWGGWLLLTGLVFSFAQGIWHPYYTTMLSPAVGALCGAGVVLLWRMYRGSAGLSWLLLPGAVALTALWAWVLVSRDTSWHGWVRYAVAGVALVAIVSLVVVKLSLASVGTGRFAAVLALVALLLAPAVWSAATATASTGGGMGGSNPMAGPNTGMRGFGGGQGGQNRGRMRYFPNQGGQPAGRPGMPGGVGQFGGGRGPGGAGLTTEQRAILDYVTRNAPNAEIKLAVEGGAMAASGYIINSDQTVIGMGGFSGQDPAPTTDQLARWVAEGRLRFVLAGGGRGGFGGGFGGRAGESGNRDQWVQQNCTVVDPAKYGNSGQAEGQQGGGFGAMTLYDCEKR